MSSFASAGGEQTPEQHNPPMQRTKGLAVLLRADVRRYLASRRTVGEPLAVDRQVRYTAQAAPYGLLRKYLDEQAASS